MTPAHYLGNRSADPIGRYLSRGREKKVETAWVGGRLGGRAATHAYYTRSQQQWRRKIFRKKWSRLPIWTAV